MQSNGTRALIALAAIALVVVAFFVLRGDDDAGEGSGGDADPPVATTTTDETTAEEPADKPEKPEEPDVPEIVIEGGVPVDGVAEIEVAKGDEVRFTAVSDTDDEIHIHGYDLYEDLPAGKKVEVAFPADLDGIYEIESHTTGELLAELRVNP
jgi:hypothetical protein